MKSEIQMLYAMNAVPEEIVCAAGKFLEYDRFRKEQRYQSGTVRKLLLIAAAVSVLFALGIAAYAMGFFSWSHRNQIPGESYSIHWEENPNGEITWNEFAHVFEFTGPEECRGVQFKEGWLPFAPNEQVNKWATDENGWRKRLVSECAPEVDSSSENFQPYMIELYYTPQFVNGGALILMNQQPEEIIEEQWDEHQVLKFYAIQHYDAINREDLDLHVPARDYHFAFVILFQPELGYIAVVSGTSDMETVEHVARELEFRTTDETISSNDFIDNCTCIDVGQG